MRRRVHAVVIARRRGDRLIQTLEQLRAQTLSPDTTTVVDLTGDATSEEVFREVLGRDSTVTIVPGRSTMGWSEAVNLARNGLPEDGWLWTLRDDTTPAPDALKRLYAAVDGAPSVVMAGPKQRMVDQTGWLREFGETVTTWGQRQAIVDRELDQGQYDRMSDVLAVGDAGLLVQLAAFDQVGGADPVLDPLDAPLDIAIRVRLAGHRVVAVPAAVVYVERGPADWRAGKELGSATMYRLDRAAWLYRRFAYTAWWSLLPLIVVSLPLSVIRAAGHFGAKRPDIALADILATVQALWRLPQALVAKSRLGRFESVGWAALRPLRMSPGDFRRRRQLQSEARFAQAEESARIMTRPSFWPAGAWLILGLLATGAVVSGPLFGAGALVGGGLLPLSDSVGALWEQVRWLQPDSVGAVWGDRVVPADPAALILALIGSAAWWSPSVAMVGLWLCGPLLSGLIAWWAGSQFLQRQVATTTFAVIWVFQPAYLYALIEGRWAGVVLHAVLPWLLATALTAHRSWQRAASAGFATAAVTALAPLLWPAVVLAWLVVVASTGWRQPVRSVLGTLPLALLPAIVWWIPRMSAPGDIALVEGLGRFVADPGVAVASAGADWWWYLMGWPTAPGLIDAFGLNIAMSVVVPWLVTPLVIAALSVVITRRIDAQMVLGVAVSLGLVTATVAPLISQGFVAMEPVTIWPGSAVMVVWLGIAVAATASLDELSPESWQWGPAVTARRVVTGVGAATVAVAVAVAVAGPLVGLWRDDALVTARPDARTLPALVAAEASTTPQQATLVITQGEAPGVFGGSIERGAGPTLDRVSSVYRLRPISPAGPEEAIAELVAQLVQPTSADPRPQLASLGVRFVSYRGDPASPAALAMGERPFLIPAGETDQSVLWQLDDAPTLASSELVPGPAQASADLLWWVTWGLWAVLALPTERTPRRRSEEGDDASSLQRVLEEDVDD